MFFFYRWTVRQTKLFTTYDAPFLSYLLLYYIYIFLKTSETSGTSYATKSLQHSCVMAMSGNHIIHYYREYNNIYMRNYRCIYMYYYSNIQFMFARLVTIYYKTSIL